MDRAASEADPIDAYCQATASWALLPWLFVSERMSQLSDRSVRVIVAQASAAAGMRHVNPHILRHSCGFYHNNKGHNTRLIQDYLGHVNPASTNAIHTNGRKAVEGLW